MKRLIGQVMALVGGAGLVWGAVSALTGSMSARVAVTDEFSLTALTGGLAGTAALVLGLVWVRD